jgi:hypothetical protein
VTRSMAEMPVLSALVMEGLCYEDEKDGVMCRLELQRVLTETGELVAIKPTRKIELMGVKDTAKSLKAWDVFGYARI